LVLVQRTEGKAHAMRTKLCSFCLVFAIGFVTLTASLATAAAETIQRSMRGTVTATNTAVDPQTIVVTVVLPNKEELIVGARVPTDTKITRGTRATKLADLKVGETAEIIYLKSPDGLIARSIHLR
ncbi:MAG: hypothetical protein AAB177_08000, partial [Nitrospirota bacterium]